MCVQRVIFDGDPGIDDALAIFTLLAARDVDVIGMTTTVGNVPVATGYRNLRNLAALAGRADIPVFRGAEIPLVRDYAFDPLVHGENGVGGALIADSTAPEQEEHAAVATCRLLRASESPVTWIATGPLTNVALALRLDPTIRDKVDRLVVMGGSTLRGNVTPAAEFNVWIDAEAWRIALESGILMTMVGLNVTHQVALDEAEYASVHAIDTPVGRACDQMLGYYKDVYQREGWGDAKLHDVVAVLEAVSPGICEVAPRRVGVETVSALTYGMTSVDERAPKESANCDVAIGVDAPAVRRRMIEAIASF